MLLKFNLERPKSKQSVRHNRAQNRYHKDPEVEIYERDLKDQAFFQTLNHTPWEGPLVIEYIIYTFPHLKRYSKKQREFFQRSGDLYKTTCPDLGDNLQKPLLDALQGIVYQNDSQICLIKNIKKVFGNETGIEIFIREI